MYHYAGNNPVKFSDPNGREDVSWSSSYGKYDIYEPIKSIDTGFSWFDKIAAPFAGAYNLIGGGINVLSNGIGTAAEYVDSGIDYLDSHINPEWTLSGGGLREDLDIISTLSVTNPQLFSDGVKCLSESAKYISAKATSNIKPITAEDIQFSDKFLKPEYKNQITDRGWTREKIADAINNYTKVESSVNKYTGNSVTKYYVDDVHYVAQDDVTKKIIQVADLNDPDWK